MNSQIITILNVIPNFHDCDYIRNQQQYVGERIRQILNSLNVKRWEYQIDSDLIIKITNDVPVDIDEIKEQIERGIR